VDFQFEVLTTYLNDGGRIPERSQFRSAHAYLAAPYGVYPTRDGWLAIAMTPLDKLAAVIGLPAIAGLPGDAAFERRDVIKREIADHIATESTAFWLERMQPADIWCAEVMDWPALFASEAFQRLDMLQTVMRPEGVPVRTTRSPIRVDGRREISRSAAPRIGEHTEALRAEFGVA
jgi:crotonobetainyl-CoA:carnitine CoA-transferase CaiB-like acyl-CoA transferase